MASYNVKKVTNKFMDMVNKIIQIANQLAHQGKKPTVALIKNQLPAPVPLPTIISALKNWVYDPTLVTNKSIESNKNNVIIEEKSPPEKTVNEALSSTITLAITPLQEEVSALRHEITALKKLVSDLYNINIAK